MADKPISDYGMKKLSMKEMGDHLKFTLDFGGNIAIFGRRGSGKTQISKEEIKSAGLKEVYLNCSVLERVDLGGYPDIRNAAELDKYINFLLPAFYKSLVEGNTKCAVLFDEVDKADPSVWAPLLEFTQFHTINGTGLPNLQAVIMTGNLTAEGGSRPCLPLLDRAEKYLAEADVNAWLDWAGKSKEIHPSVSAYIHDHPDDLYGDVDPGEIYADPSPRGWHNASKILFFGESKNYNGRLLTDKVSGCVGKKAGTRYSQYYEHYQVLLPLIARVWEGHNVEAEWNKLEPSRKMVASMIVCARLAREIDKCEDGKAPAVSKTIAKFMSFVDEEMTLIAMRSQIGLNRMIIHGLDEQPGWSDLLNKISDRVSE